MSSSTRFSFLRYGFALLVTSFGCVLQALLIHRLGNRTPFLFFFPAIIISAWYGGMRPGFLSTGISLLLADFFFLEPYHSFVIKNPSDEVASIIFAGIGVTISWMVGELRAIQQRSIQLARIVESSDDAIISKSLDGIIQSWNFGAEKIYGYTAKEAVGQPITLLLPEGQPDEVPFILEKLLKGDRVETYEALRKRRDGEIITVSLTASPILDHRNQLVGASSITRDITAQRRIETALKRSEERLRAAMQGSLSAFYVFQSVRDETGRIIDFRFEDLNARAADLISKTEGEAVGRRLTELFPNSGRDGYIEKYARVIETGTPFEEELATTAPGVTAAWIHQQVVPLEDGVAITSADISEQKLLEETLQRKIEEMAELDRRKDQFLAMLGHELRNPLGAMRNALYVFTLKDVDPSTFDRLREILERQVRQMAFIVDDLLDVSRIAQGKITLRHERIDLNRLIRETVEDSRAMMERSEVSLSVTLSDSPIELEGDAKRLSQVMANLLSNAAKFTDSGGSVAVEVSKDETAREAAVKVRDTGIGISPELLTRIFETFAQVEDSRNLSRGGLGLGLALVKGLVELHGGRVSARSDGPGHGAEFTFILPLEGKGSWHGSG
jgi:PAS domain S-box-containing protein